MRPAPVGNLRNESEQLSRNKKNKKRDQKREKKKKKEEQQSARQSTEHSITSLLRLFLVVVLLHACQRLQNMSYGYFR